LIVLGKGAVRREAKIAENLRNIHRVEENQIWKSQIFVWSKPPQFSLSLADFLWRKQQTSGIRGCIWLENRLSVWLPSKNKEKQQRRKIKEGRNV
jgi:hypothetical protein